MKASVFIATSLDGYIARPDDSLDWLEVEGANEDHGFAAFMARVDVLVMGRNTYDVVRAMGVPWPYSDTPVIVLTSRPIDIPDDLAAVIEPSSLSPRALIAELEDRGFEHAYVDGGKTIQSFLEAGLIDRITMTRIPVLIGEGIPLFGSLPQDVQLRHVDTIAYTSGLVQSTYDVI